MRNDAYDCAKLYKAKMKKAHDQSILRKSFELGQRVDECLKVLILTP
jgi:hypothetical protein